MNEVYSNNLIKKVEGIVRNACASKANHFGYGIWTHHILQVVRIGKSLAKKFNADEEIVELAALLHDYAGIKDYSLHKNHHIHGAEESEKILTALNYPSDKMGKVKGCILNHRGSVPGKINSPEARCLTNADAIAHITNASSLLYMVYVEWGFDIDEGRNWVRKKLLRTWEKIDPEIQNDFEEIYSSALKFLRTAEPKAETGKRHA